MKLFPGQSRPLSAEQCTRLPVGRLLFSRARSRWIKLVHHSVCSFSQDISWTDGKSNTRTSCVNICKPFYIGQKKKSAFEDSVKRKKIIPPNCMLGGAPIYAKWQWFFVHFKKEVVGAWLLSIVKHKFSRLIITCCKEEQWQWAL